MEVPKEFDPLPQTLSDCVSLSFEVRQMLFLGKSHPWANISLGESCDNFHGHWSIQISPENKAPRDWSTWISPEIGMDQWLPNLSESSGQHRHWSIDCSSLYFGTPKHLNGPQKSIKWSEDTLKVHLNAPKRHFSDHLIGIFWSSKCAFWNSRISGSLWGQDDRNFRPF